MPKRSYAQVSTKALVAKARKYQKAKTNRTMTMAIAAARKVEVKGMDTTMILSPIISTTSTNASSFVMNLIQQGAGSWNRIGRKVSLKSLRLCGVLEWTYAPLATSGSLVDNYVRMVVVWDKQPSGGSIPTFDEVFGITTQDGTEAGAILAPIKYDNMERFSVLRDKRYDFDVEAYNSATGTTNSVLQCEHIDEYIDLKGRATIFSGQSNPMTIADISTGGLYVYFRAYRNTDPGSVCKTELAFGRLRYVDA